MVRRYWLLSLVAVFTLCSSLPVTAEAGFQADDLQVQYTFGDQITFQTRILAQSQVKEVVSFVQVQGENSTIVSHAVLQPDGRAVYIHDLSQKPFRAFSMIEYWFEVRLEDGQTFNSPHGIFYFEDNRFDWKVMEAEPFRVHWYEGDTAFAQDILDVARQGLIQVHNLLSLESPPIIDIYVYDSANEMQATLMVDGQNWVAGRADVDLSVMAVSLPKGPNQRLEMERQMPHELMHISLYHTLGNGYFNLPVWFNEGLASIAELYTNPEYQVLLENAYDEDSLISLADLCRSFPSDSYGAQMAYAESAYFTRYLYRQYGRSQLERLLQNYSEGMECGRGLEVTLEQSLPQLEALWYMEVFNSKPGIVAFDNLMPWFTVLFIVLTVPLVFTINGLFKPRPLPASQVVRNHKKELKEAQSLRRV